VPARGGKGGGLTRTDRRVRGAMLGLGFRAASDELPFRLLKVELSPFSWHLQRGSNIKNLVCELRSQMQLIQIGASYVRYSSNGSMGTAESQTW
jgi:hypothetical protein